MKLVVEIKDLEEMTFLKQMLKKLNIRVISEEKEEEKDQKKAIEALDEISKRGKVAKLIKDPVSWQKDLRKDRKLPLRD